MCVLDFLQERSHNTNPGDFESMFIKTAGSLTRRNPASKKQQERACARLLGISRNLQERSESGQAGEPEKSGPWRQEQEVSSGPVAATHGKSRRDP